jgi:Ca-activated chloride channel homolog
MKADFLLDYDVVTVEREHKLYLMARLTAGSAPDTAARRPLNISLVIDRSGSMAGNKIDYTRQAASLLVQNLTPDDLFSIVLYNEKVETFLPPQRVDHKDLLVQRISGIKAGGTTNLSAGWLEGVKHVADYHRAQQVNRVILMSDGLTNRGITETRKLVEIAQQKREQGVATTTMGLGDDFNEDLLMAIADAGGGAFYFIESPEVTPAIFQEELTGLLRVVGQNLVITMTPSDLVTHTRQMNAYPENKVGSSVAYRMGDVYGEETKALMLELAIPALSNVGDIEIARLRFEYDELQGQGSEHQVMEMSVKINVTPPELAPGEDVENKEVRRSALLLAAAEARRKAVKLADDGQYGEAARLLREAAEAIRDSGLQDGALQEERGALINQAADLDKGAAAYQKYSRKSMSTQAYFTERGSHENTQAFRLREQQRKGGGTDATEAGDPAYESRKTYFFEVPPLPQDASDPVAPISSLSPTHLRWGDQVFALDADLIRLGRAAQNEIVINTAGISRFHCQIKRNGQRLILEDLNSTNGTHVAGQPLNGPYALHEGDVVYLCDQRLTFTREKDD